MLRKGESSQAFYFWRFKKFIKWGYTNNAFYQKIYAGTPVLKYIPIYLKIVVLSPFLTDQASVLARRGLGSRSCLIYFYRICEKDHSRCLYKMNEYLKLNSYTR